MEADGGNAVEDNGLATILQSSISELDGEGGADGEPSSTVLSRCSTYSYNPADFPRACEIEEFMSPSFQWPASSSASFASKYIPERRQHPQDNACRSSSRPCLAYTTPQVGFAWWRRRKRQQGAGHLVMSAPAHLVRFSLQELLLATRGFRSHLLGYTCMGDQIYKGRLPDGSIVAVKKVKSYAHQIEFETELKATPPNPPRNLLRLIGFCVTRTERLLVYPYTANGNLADCLGGLRPSHPPLDWATRIRIALGAARGISYLHSHCTPKIVHRDIHAGNIFLDEDFEPLIGGFGLALLMDGGEDTHVCDVVRGTGGCLAPEYACTGVVSEEIDVFGYGVMLLELVSGQRGLGIDPLSAGEMIMMLEWMRLKIEANMLAGPDLPHNYFDKEHLIMIARLCTQASPVDRPKMSEVVMMLEEIGRPGLLERWEERLHRIMERQKAGARPSRMTSRKSTDDLESVELSSPG